MSSKPISRRRIVAAAAGLALVAGPLAVAGGADATALPATASRHVKRPPLALDLLAINDFHGNLEKISPISSSGRINSTPAGGAAYLATHLDMLRRRAHARDAHTITVAAGDLIGASPLLSAAFHDEPTITAMNELGLQVASVGNHEFDEGYKELLRMQHGGCLDDGPDGANNQNSCPDGQPFAGAKFHYLAANVRYAGSDRTVFPSAWVKKVGPVKVGFIGMTLKDTPNIVTKAGVEGLAFTDEVRTANRVARKLDRRGVHSIIVLLHQGAVPTDPTQYNGCVGVDGPGLDIAKRLSPRIDAIVSGHTHQAYNCLVKDPAGRRRLFTSGSSFGRLVTQIRLKINRRTGEVIRSKSRARNVIVTNEDGTAARQDIADLIAKFKQLVAPIEGKVIGHLDTTAVKVSRTPDADGSGDSPLGNLIADAQRTDASTVPDSGPAAGKAPVVALMNPGGIRDDLVANSDHEITFGAAFRVQPFNNYVVSMDLTGQQLLDVLNEQWNGRNEGTANNKILQVSGLTYTWDQSDAAGSGDAIVPGSVTVGGAALDPQATYRVVVNSFLSDGGDGFATLADGQNKYFGGLDIDSLANYLSAAANDPYSPTTPDRVNAQP